MEDWVQVLNLWRIFRTEMKLPVYTFEACVAALLQRRTPKIPPWVLTRWFNTGPSGTSFFGTRFKVLGFGHSVWSKLLLQKSEFSSDPSEIYICCTKKVVGWCALLGLGFGDIGI